MTTTSPFSPLHISVWSSAIYLIRSGQLEQTIQHILQLDYIMALKIVIQLYPKCQKCRPKAFSIAAEVYGVNRVEVERDNKVVVIGEDIDAAGLTSLIRKKVCKASLELVQAA